MLPEPWYFTAQDLSQQLHIELHNDHILKGNKQKLSLAGKITIMYYLKWIMESIQLFILLGKITQSVIENKILPDAKEFY